MHCNTICTALFSDNIKDSFQKQSSITLAARLRLHSNGGVFRLGLRFGFILKKNKSEHDFIFEGLKHCKSSKPHNACNFSIPVLFGVTTLCNSCFGQAYDSLLDGYCLYLSELCLGHISGYQV